MKFRLSLVLYLILLMLGPVLARAQNENEAQRWSRFEPEFKAFAEADRVKAPTPGGILFVGSSIFREWTKVSEQMAPLPVLNRAFGGSRTNDQLARFGQIVPPYAPRIIVFYCGSNDLMANEAPEAIFARFKAFSERSCAALPGLRFVYVSSTRSPDRVDKWDRVDRYNQLAREYCAATPGHTFVYLNPLLVDSGGQPRFELYRDDKLHFHPPAYIEFTKALKPVLERIWSELGVATGSHSTIPQTSH